MKKTEPPRLIKHFFEWYCDSAFVEDLVGDMDEMFIRNIKNKSIRKAKFIYTLQVLSLVFSYGLRRRKQHTPESIRDSRSIHTGILGHYLKVAGRNLYKHKRFSFISIIGLALGMFTFMILINLVSDHLLFDSWNSRRDRVFRLVSTNEKNQTIRATTPLPLVNELMEKYSGVEQGVRFERGFGNEIGNKLLEKESIPLAGFFAGPDVFDVFEYELEYGDPSQALKEPYTVVLTSNTSIKLFGRRDPMGQLVNMGNIGMYKVTGVLRETNKKTHIKFDALASLSSVAGLKAAGKNLDPAGLGQPNLNEWQLINNGWGYIVLKEGTKTEDVERYLSEISKAHYQSINEEDRWSFALQSLTDISPGTTRGNEIGPVLDWRIIFFVGIIALSILATACFNFANLSVARSLARSREIGIRKVTGGSRWQIFIQFELESISIALMAATFAILLIVMAKAFLPGNMLFQMIQLDLILSPVVLSVYLLFAFVAGFLAGLFPSVVLSGLMPIKTLRNLTNVKMIKGVAIREWLVVSQFSIALIFIISAIVVYNQFNLFLNSDRGFEVKHNLVVKLNNTSAEQLKTELSKSGAVRDVSAASHVPGTFIRYNGTFRKPGDTDWSTLCYYSVDEDYLNSLHVQLSTGTFFQKEAGNTNKNLAIINEEAVKYFHFADAASAIGQIIEYGKDSSSLEITAVVKDYNHNMLTQHIEPMVLINRPAEFDILQVTYSDFDLASAAIEKAWANVNPQLKVEYVMMEDEISKFYRLIVGDIVKILSLLAFLALTICCLGLLGIVCYMTEIRLKEVAIRKVFGSDNAALFLLLSKRYIRIISFSLLFGIPLALLINNAWLQNIAYRTHIDLPVILYGVGILLVLSGMTIYSQLSRSITIRPIEHIRGE